MLKLTLISALIAAGGKLAAGLGAVLMRSVRQGSIIRNTSAARVEPITIIDSNVMHYERMDDLAHFSLNTFAAIYIQGIALSGTTVGNVAIQKRLEAHNPTNSGGQFSLEAIINQPNEPVARAILNDEDELYENGLPSGEDYISLESASGRGPSSNVAKAAEALRDVNSLSVGKVLTVELKDGTETVNVPVTVRLASVVADNEVLVQALMARFKSGETALELKTGFKSGRLKLIRDVLFCRHLVREHYKQLIKDQDGIYAKLNPDRAQDYVRAAVSGNMNLARASNIAIVDSDTMARVEARLGGKISNLNFRQRLLEMTGIMIFVVVNQEEDIVTFYLDTVSEGTMVSGRNLNRVAKNDGPDIAQLLSSMISGSRPRML